MVFLIRGLVKKLMQEEAKKVGGFIARLILGVYAEKIMEIGTKVNYIERDVEEIKKDNKQYGVSIAKLQQAMKGLGVGDSPTVPSEKGKKILEDSKFNEVYPTIKTKIFEIIEKEYKPTTLYDVEQSAFFALSDLEKVGTLNFLKTYAVNNTDIELKTIFLVASWIIRDDYAKVKNIKNEVTNKEDFDKLLDKASKPKRKL